MQHVVFNRLVRFIGATGILFLPCFASAQLSLSAHTGIGTYQMEDLKSFQQTLSARWPVKPNTIASFPAYWYYEVTLRNRFDNALTAGAAVSFGSTGGRIYYSDYSGSIWADQMASYVSWAGSFGTNKSFFNGQLNLWAEIRPGVTITTLSLSQNEILGTSKTRFESTYHSVNFMIQPTVGAEYYFKRISLNASVGYNANISNGDLQASGNNTLATATGANAHADWSGLRASLGLGVKIDDKQPSAHGAVSLALGGGLDYGGFGANLLAYPHDNVGAFVGVGYALAGLGTNAGIKIRFNSPTNRRGYLLAMYGYNAAIVVSNVQDYKKLFYGPSFGAGMDFKPGLGGHWSLGVMIPIRSADVDSYINTLRGQGASFKNTLLPFTISVGFRFITFNEETLKPH